MKVKEEEVQQRETYKHTETTSTYQNKRTIERIGHW